MIQHEHILDVVLCCITRISFLFRSRSLISHVQIDQSICQIVLRFDTGTVICAYFSPQDYKL